MKSCFKALVTLVLLVLLAILAAAVLGATALQHAAREWLAEGLGEVYGVPVTIEDSWLVPHEGRLEITNLELANPEAYEPGTALRFGRITAHFDPWSLLSDPIVVHEVTLSGLAGHGRIKMPEGLSLLALAEHAEETAAGAPGGNGAGGPDDGESPADSPDAPVLRRRTYLVEKLVVADGQLSFSAKLLPVGPLDIELEPFETDALASGGAKRFGEVAGGILRQVLARGVTLEGALRPLAGVFRDGSEDKEPAGESEPRQPES